MNAFLQLENLVKLVKSDKQEKQETKEKQEKCKGTFKIKRNPKQEEMDILSSLTTEQGLDIVGNKEDNMVLTATTTINIKKRRVSKKLEHESYPPIVKDDATVDFSL